MKTILVVDDDAAIAKYAAEVLRRAGYPTIEAYGMPQAMLLIRSRPEPIGLVISDIRMPEGSGVELAAAIERIRPGSTVIYMSGLVDSMVVDALQHMHCTVLLKPFTPQKIVEHVRAILGPAEAVAAQRKPVGFSGNFAPDHQVALPASREAS